MSEDWQAGDLALCIKDGWDGFGLGLGLKKGRIYSVSAVGVGPSGRLGLWIDEVPDHLHGKWRAVTRFIKVTPPEADEFDRETIELMRGKPVEVTKVSGG